MRNGAQSSELVFTYSGDYTPNITFNPALPNGIVFDSTTKVFSSANGIANGTSVIETTIVAQDTPYKVFTTTFNVVGVVTETLTATSAELTFDANNAQTINTFTWSYSGSSPIDVSIVGQLPTGITSAINGNSIVFTGTGSSYEQNGTTSLQVTLTAVDAYPVTVQVDLMIVGITVVDENTPLTFKAVEGGASVYSLKSSGHLSGIKYSKNNGSWQNYNNGTYALYFELNEGDTVALSSTEACTFSNGFNGSGKLKVYGNPHSVQNWDNSASCQDLFHALNEHLVDVKDIYITSPISAQNSYDRAFGGSYIKQVVDFDKFSGITSTATFAYKEMYGGCSQLSSIRLPKVELSCLPAAIYYDAFKNCTGLLSAIIEQEVIAPDYDHRQTFYNTFNGCTSLKYIDVNFTSWGDSKRDGTTNWVTNVAANGIFVKPSGLPLTADNSHIPTGWTVINKGGDNQMFICNNDNTNGAEVASIGEDGTITYA